MAVLTGYAAAGGGFNNYLGGLRSRGMIRCDGDRLTITQAGIEALGSWEPLPTGCGLVDSWRARLGKAERLILESDPQDTNCHGHIAHPVSRLAGTKPGSALTERYVWSTS